MNKRIKRIIAMTLVLGAFVSVAPNKYFSLLDTKAYASSSDDYGLEDLQVNKSNSSDEDDDNELTMYTDNDYDTSTGFERNRDAYYVKTSANAIRIKIGKLDGYTYKIFKGTSKEAFSSSDDLDLKVGTNVFYVRTYETGDFDSKNIEKNEVRCYEIHVERKSSAEVYLKDISLDNEDMSLSDGDISNVNFSKNKSSYDVEVKSKIDEITITAKPEDSDYTVKIDGTKVTSDDNFRKK